VTTGTALDGNGDPITDSSGNPFTVTDDSDSGTNPNSTNPNDPGDAGSSDDPTPLLIPDVGIAKFSGDSVANGDNWDVVFTLVMENTGTATLTNLTMIDDVTTEFGNAFVSASGITVGSLSGTGTLPGANANWSTDTSTNMLVGGVLDAGSSFDLSFTVTIDPDGLDSVSQGLVNRANGGGDGVYPDGSPLIDADGNQITVGDDSNNGDDPNSDEDGSTPILIADLSIAKAVLGESTLLDNGNYSVSYQLVVENTGTVDLADLSLIEDLGTQFGAGLVNAGGLTMTAGPSGAASAITANAAFDGNGVTEMMDSTAAGFLEVGDSFTLEFNVEIDAAGLPNATATNSVATNSVSGNAVGVDQNGDPIVNADGNQLTANDDSDSGSDPSSNNPGEPGDTSGSDDPTPVPFFKPEPLPSAALPEQPVSNFEDTADLLASTTDPVRPLFRPFGEAKLVILNMVESLRSLNSVELPLHGNSLDADNSEDLLHEYVSQEESQGFSSGKGYRGTISVDPTDECGRFFIDTIVDNDMVSVIARSTIDPTRSIGVTGYSVTLANGDALPEWISRIDNGEILIDRPAGLEVIALKIVAHRDGAEDLVRFVEIDTSTGLIREQQQKGTLVAGFYSELENSANDDETESETIREAAE